MIKLDMGAKEPLYLQVKAGLLAQINSGAFSPDQPIPTERELSEALGLSRLTVRRSIVELAQQGLLRRIPGRGTFIVSGAAKPAISAVSLLLSGEQVPYDISGPFFMHLLSGLYSAIQPATLAMRGIGTSPEQLRDSQGIVALWVIEQQKLVELAALGIPMVGYECAPDPAAPAFDNISHANEGGSHAAACSLINLGHRDIGIAMHATSVAKERHAGFERAMRQHGLPIPPERIINTMSTSEAGYALGRRLLLDPDNAPTALMCTDDTIAYGVMAAMQEAGRSVPDFISIIGYGDLGRFTTPALSSVRMDIAASGREAVRLLKERSANPSLPARSVILPTEYIRRASCAPPRPGR
jgi:DNA-binding LacI/PurR family transcriptional regulator/DNA-binding transcriptional regulator YhcF (GntR family)